MPERGNQQFQKKLSEKYFHYFVILTVIAVSAYAILPMLVFREKYIFTIHDGLDSYAGLVQMIHDRGIYFRLNKSLPIMHNMPWKYSCITYNLYDFLNCVFGYVTGQICTRIIGVCLGFFSMAWLLKFLFHDNDFMQRDLIYLVSIAYSITPCAPNRLIAYASLPMIFLLFVYLKRKDAFTYLVFIAFIYPFFSSFASVLVFVILIWFVSSIVFCIKCRKININLFIAFFLMCISSVIVNINYFLVALSADETNRSLQILLNKEDGLTYFKNYLLNGQYHSTALHGYILLPFLLLSSVYIFCRYKRHSDNKRKIYMIGSIVGGGWLLWIFSAFILTFQEMGYSSGILVVDGFQWGRLAGIMRFVWYLMLGAIVFAAPENDSFRTDCKGILTGVFAGGILLFLLFLLFRDVGYPSGSTFFDGFLVIICHQFPPGN